MPVSLLLERHAEQFQPIAGARRHDQVLAPELDAVPVASLTAHAWLCCGSYRWVIAICWCSVAPGGWSKIAARSVIWRPVTVALFGSGALRLRIVYHAGAPASMGRNGWRCLWRGRVMSSSITHPVQPSGAAECGGAMAVPSAPVQLAPGVDLSTAPAATLQAMAPALRVSGRDAGALGGTWRPKA